MNWEETIEFFLLRSPNVRYVVIGSILIGASAAVVGCFLFLRKRALVGDAIAHSVLPGVAISFLLFNSKHPAVLLGGAIVTGWLSLLLINWITNHSKIKADTAIGLALSWFFGIGILLLTAIQKSGNASQSGLDKFLFGKASSLVKDDVVLFGIVSVVLIATVILFFKPLKLITFDRDFAIAKGIKVGFFEFLLSSLTVISVATGIQAVGVVLMAALLITPAAAARFWTNDLKKMVFLAGIFGALSGLLGSFVSYNIPRMPTGPWIVVIISAIAVFSFFFGAKKGLINRLIKQRNISKKIVSENLLKLFYQLGEENENFQEWRSKDDITNRRFFIPRELSLGLKVLGRHDFIEKQGDRYRLTSDGLEEGKRIVRLHRLWEMYLNQYLKIAPDHVHDDAEAIEHIITPEIEAELLDLMDHPDKDPHDTVIPYSNEEFRMKN